MHTFESIVTFIFWGGIIWLSFLELYNSHRTDNIGTENREEDSFKKDIDEIKNRLINIRNKKLKQHINVTNKKYMSRADKQQYLKSLEWKTYREKVFTRDNYQCQICSSMNNLNCHHITYENLGSEKLKDCITLCSDCHTQLHEKLGYDRDTVYPIF